MRTAVLSLSCFLAAGTLFAQQTAPATSPAKPASQPGAPSRAQSVAGMPAQPAEKLPDHPLTDDQAAKILVIFGGDKMKEDVKAGMTNLIRTRMPFAPKDVSDDFDQSLAKMDVNAALIAVYKRHLSVEDADALIAFYKTPAGKEAIDAMPELLQQQEQAAVNLGRKTAQEVVDRHRPEIDAAAKAYRDEHAPKPAPSLNAPAPGAAPGTAAPATKPSTTTPPPQQ
jgi:hypothetical protein